MKKTIIAIDLGKSGGIAVFHPTIRDEEYPPTVQKMPTLPNGEVDLQELFQIFWGTKNPLIVFEHITPLHLASAKSNWSLAEQGGMIIGLCAAMKLEFRRVPPKTWQRDLLRDVPPIRDKKGSVDTKAQALLKVRQLYPDLNLLATPRSKVPHEGIVDAICIGEWALNFLK